MRDSKDGPVQLDPTSDSCAVLVWCTAAQAAQLVGSIGGSIIGDLGDTCYAMVGWPWDDDRTDKENDAEHDRAWIGVLDDIDLADLNWEEVS